MRDLHQPQHLVAVLEAADIAVRTLVTPRDSTADPGALLAMASMAATVRKLAQVATAGTRGSPTALSASGWLSHLPSTTSSSHQEATQDHLTSPQLKGLFKALKRSITTMVMTLQPAGTAGGGISAQRTRGLFSLGAAPSATALLAEDASRTQALRRCTFTLVLCLLQLCFWAQEVGQMDAMEEDLVSWSLQQMAGMGVDVLSGPNMTPSRGSPSRGAELMTAMVFSSLIAASSPAMLLPGCSHLGCENLRGASEAGLPTLLCGGCKGVRYCSVGCQHAAWLVGGHSMYCRGKRR